MSGVRLSVLDQTLIRSGSTVGAALREARYLAQNAERLGYERIWFTEHHSAPGVASAATTLVIGYVAEGTNAIRVGSGGVMLPNHAPLIIAEQFGTLEQLYPGRIDLGMGRSHGTKAETVVALRRPPDAVERFADDVRELISLLGTTNAAHPVQAIPGSGSHVPLWMLGSSVSGAELAGRLGVPFAFASHFAPHALRAAAETYRASFRPSDALQSPYLAITTNTVVAEDDQTAQHAFTAYQQFMTNNLARGAWAKLPHPIEDMNLFWTDSERALVRQVLAGALVGSPATVRSHLDTLITTSGADEVMVSPVAATLEERIETLDYLTRVVDIPRGVSR